MKKHLLHIIILSVALVVPTSSHAEFELQNTHHYTLKNGLEIYVKPDSRAPIVVTQIWYKVGSSYEPNGLTGISHMLEHMMFEGTQTVARGEYGRMISQKGGQYNAFTSHDFTAYYSILPKTEIGLAFKLEADRMQNLKLSPTAFAQENKVVQEERRLRTDDKPQALIWERFSALANITSPYHHPVVGWAKDIQNYTLDDLRDWYETWYAPNNATLVVVGDVIPDQVYQLAKRYFEPLQPSDDIPKLKPEIPPETFGQRGISVRLPAKVPFLIMGYNVPSLKTAPEPWQAYALEVAVAALDGGDSARLKTELVRNTQMATGINANYNLYSLFSGVMTISGIPSQQQTTASLREAILQQITRLQTTFVSEQELKRIKAQVLANKVFNKDSMEQQATEIGSLVSVGLSPQTAEDYSQKIQAITAAQVQAVARQYFTVNRLTSAMLIPQPLPLSKKQL